MANNKKLGLPGGPNEYVTHVSDLFSTEGYKRNSPDVNNPFNIIPSGNITMEGVDFPVMGTDNLGNSQMMTPGNNYEFPGDQVFEVPIAKTGGGLLDKTMKCNSCGWEWKAADGGADVSTCHKCGSSALPKAQFGIPSAAKLIKSGLQQGVKYSDDIASALKNVFNGGISDDVVRAGIDKNFLTRPLTPLTKNELTSGKQLYRKIGSTKGLKDLIDKGGAQAPNPFRMKSGVTVDTPFFGIDKKPIESYSGLFAVETPLPSKSKYNWSTQVGGTSNLGVAPFDKATNSPIKNIPLDDLEVFRKKWFSNNYKKLDKQNLQKELESASLQDLSEKLYKWGIRGYAADQILNDGDLTGGKAVEIIEEYYNNINKKQEGGDLPKAQKGIKKEFPKFNLSNQNLNLDERANNLTVQDNIPSSQSLKVIPELYEDNYSVTGKQQLQPQTGNDMVSAYDKPDTYDKVTDILASPLTSLSYFLSGQDIPDSLPLGMENRNPHDAIIDMFNPFAMAKYAVQSNKTFDNAEPLSFNSTTGGIDGMGEYTNAGFEALGAIPIVPAWLKYGKNLNSPITKTIKPTALAPVVNTVGKTNKVVNNAWKVKPLPGLHLKSTMDNGAISKIIESKTGRINTEQALAIIKKESGGLEKVDLIKQQFGDVIPKKIDYNEFRTIVQKSLVPLELKINPDGRAVYGLDQIGYGSFWDDGKKLSAAGILENNKLTISNGTQFGGGSSMHGNPDDTLGHVHFLRDVDNPQTLTVTQIQSDAFQGGYATMPKTKEAANFNIAKNEKHLEGQKRIWNSAVQQPDGSWLYPNGDFIPDAIHQQGVQGQEAINAMQRAEAKNLSQKQLLKKNHQERYLQEIVNYAAQRGDLNKIRIPTMETAAKVQNYIPNIPGVGSEATSSGSALFNLQTMQSSYAPGSAKFIEFQTEIDKINNLRPSFNLNDYGKTEQSILKKYKDQTKNIKKLYGQDVITVTDAKGNTWYEFNIPESFKSGTGEIKAFKEGGSLPKAQPGKEIFKQGAKQIAKNSDEIILALKRFFNKTDDFTSSINWGSWNKEIPTNEVLMKEYNAIEQATKKNGTWMKYSDGSAFKGSPEQFVQMNSKNLYNFAGGKEAAEQMYKNPKFRGGHQHIDDFINRDRNDWATFLTDNKKNAESYATSDGTTKEFFNPAVNKPGEWVDGIYQLAFPNNLPTVTSNANGRSWRLLDYDDRIAQGLTNNRVDIHQKNLLNWSDGFLDDYNLQGYNPSNKYLSTDDYAAYVKNKANNEVVAKIKNVKDQMGTSTDIPTNTVYAVDAERVPLKSLLYNNGLFDMTNPNIYKAIVPGAIGAGAVSQMGPKQEDGQFQNGGSLPKAQNAGEDVQNAQQNVQNRAVIFAESPEYNTYPYDINEPIYDGEGNLIANYPSELQALYDNFNQSKTEEQNLNDKRTAEISQNGYLQFLMIEQDKMKKQRDDIYNKYIKMSDPALSTPAIDIKKIYKKHNNLVKQISEFRKQQSNIVGEIDKRYNLQLEPLYSNIRRNKEGFYNSEFNPVTKSMDSTFYKEAQNLQRVYEKLQPNTNVEIVPIFRDPDTMREKVADLNKNDAMFLFGHSGSKLGGIPNNEIANIFQESKAENCYLGSCDFEVYIEPYTNMVGKNVNYRPSGSWWGVNPNGSTIDEAMWSRVTDQKTGEWNELETAKIITPTLGVDYQTKKLKKGGGIEKYTMYKDYVNGIYTGDKKESIAQKNYDRLNRLHYREAKTNQMTPANYILSYLME